MYTEVFFAFFLVLALIAGLMLFLKRIRGKYAGGKNASFNISSMCYIDNKRKVVSLRYRDVQYILLLGNTDILIDRFDLKNEDSDQPT